MKLITIIFLSSLISLFAQQESIINIWPHNNVDEEHRTLRIGVSDNATDGIDSGLGEFELPYGFLPFGGQFVIYTEWENSTDYEPAQMMWSYVNIDKKPDENIFTKEFKLKSWQGEADTTFLVFGLNASNIDSAFVSYFDVLGGVTYKYDILENDTVPIVDNLRLQQGLNLNFVIHYNFIVSSIENNKINTKIYPNPAKDVIFIEDTGLFNYSIRNQFGQIVKSNNNYCDGYKVDISNLPSGLYFIESKLIDGRKSIQKFMKTN